ncbi:phosphoribosylformylglycinamidine synthase subunit PurS [Domibacillus sp. A3M-37]|uniref:Phosphoribosylformylglycinamidine synthase subunit PurS n=1 Tax=Domibacillus enclensis TaxID=1017273 RepID=A0A1N6W5T4_9BACI|nr:MULTISPECIES: phosphoribosylformylglycinamidine synthase subunit PurS [Domibacillus]MCP3762323.1 phosphoribosylformylglycinamidine synthase subunit PurS [Domibacillus sp. A3M-37]OXS77856.1 phosphoribosylformylglycinamidine synthase subunit PurS [Domibacillus enclensis]SIQ85513.1 phosphoribosylformylglycinamidine synthase [Domibacillus enclensis]
MYKVKVYVTLRESVLDPQGKAVQQSLSSLGYQGVEDVRIGKYMELQFDDSVTDVEGTVKEVCEKLLSNPVIEDYRYEIEESANQ